MELLERAEKAIYIYTHGYLETLKIERKNVIIGKNLLGRLRSIFAELIKEVRIYISSEPKIIDYQNQIVCLVNSKNNYEALKFLKAEKEFFLLQTSSNKELDKDIVHLKFQNKVWFNFLFLFYLPKILIGKKAKYVLLLYKAFGYTEMFKKEFKKNRPKAVVFTNDHTPLMRSFLIACKELKIPTIYLQHAAVSKFFPPLIFDLALLDGKVSADIYRKIGETECKIKYVGIPKLDEAIQNNRVRTTVNRVGLAINQNDDTEIVKEVVNSLQQNGFSVIFRKHPLDKRQLPLDKNIIDGNSMSVFEFIYHSDFLIAADSSIHIEANTLKCRSLYYMLHANMNAVDYYGFIKNGFIEKVNNLEGIVQYIKEFRYSSFDFSSPSFRYYNAAIGTEFYGNSSGLVKKIIDENINN